MLSETTITNFVLCHNVAKAIHWEIESHIKPRAPADFRMQGMLQFTERCESLTVPNSRKIHVELYANRVHLPGRGPLTVLSFRSVATRRRCAGGPPVRTETDPTGSTVRPVLRTQHQLGAGLS